MIEERGDSAFEGLLAADRVLVADGGMGTLLFDRGLDVGGCPELLHVERPDVVASIHRENQLTPSDQEGFDGQILVMSAVGDEACWPMFGFLGHAEQDAKWRNRPILTQKLDPLDGQRRTNRVGNPLSEPHVE